MLDDKRKSKYFIGGMLAGSIIGSLAGVLFAPKSGKELRRDISDKGTRILDDTNDLIENAGKKAAGILSDARKKAEEIIEGSKKKFESITHGAEDLVKQEKDKVEKEVSKIRSAVRSGNDELLEDRNKMHSGSLNHNSDRTGTSQEEKGKYNKSKV